MTNTVLKDVVSANPSFTKVVETLFGRVITLKESMSSTTLEGVKLPKGLSSIRKTSGYKSSIIKNAFEDGSCQKMTRLAQKKKISVSTLSRRVENMRGKGLIRSRKPLLIMAKKRPASSASLLNDLKNHGIRFLIFSDEKTFTLDSVFNKQNYQKRLAAESNLL